jgi:hypothetical protein
MYGLLAIGRTGDWQVDLDEINDKAADARSRWGLTISNPSFHIQLEIYTLGVLSELANFLDLSGGPGVELCIGSWAQAKVILVSAEGRKQIRLLSPAINETEWPALLELNLTTDQSRKFAEALHDLLKNLTE